MIKWLFPNFCHISAKCGWILVQYGSFQRLWKSSNHKLQKDRKARSARARVSGSEKSSGAWRPARTVETIVAARNEELIQYKTLYHPSRSPPLPLRPWYHMQHFLSHSSSFCSAGWTLSHFPFLHSLETELPFPITPHTYVVWYDCTICTSYWIMLHTVGELPV